MLAQERLQVLRVVVAVEEWEQTTPHLAAAERSIREMSEDLRPDRVIWSLVSASRALRGSPRAPATVEPEGEDMVVLAQTVGLAVGQYQEMVGQVDLVIHFRGRVQL
jgi:hypothetical protein